MARAVSFPAIVLVPATFACAASAPAKLPHEKSPVVKAPTTRSCGGLSDFMSAK